jgi:hypothetical protein
VRCLNDPPWIEPVVPVVLDLTAHENDVEDSGMALDWTIDGEEHCVVSGQDSDDDVLSLTPQAGYVGSDTVTLHLRDSLGAEATQELVVTWEEVIQVQTQEVRVSSSADDAEEKPTGTVGRSSSDLELVYDGGNQLVGMRFAGLDVPRGVTIVSAYVQFQVDEKNSVETMLTIQGQAVDDAAAFTSLTGDISLRSRTGASVTGAPPAWDVGG